LKFGFQRKLCVKSPGDSNTYTLRRWAGVSKSAGGVIELMLQVPPPPPSPPPEHWFAQLSMAEIAAVSPAWLAAASIAKRQLASAPEYWAYWEQVLYADAMMLLMTCCLTDIERLTHAFMQLSI
jgi:hypothetical protein